jgi:c-di-GMP-binding flagellar brake protein YcgR
MNTTYQYARKFPRVEAAFPVDYEVNETSGKAEAASLGGGGLFVGILHSLSPGTEMKLRFRAAKHLPLIEARAQVRYQVSSRGVGLEFTEIEPSDRDRLLRLIHHRNGDKRRFPRAPLATQVEHESGSFIGFCKDVSVGGMFIETENPLLPGTVLQLRFNLDDGPICRAAAEVRYEVKRLGVGVCFTSISPDDQMRIESYVAKAAV